MSLALLLALQAAPAAPQAAPLAAAPVNQMEIPRLRVEFDLARYVPADPCGPGVAGSDIVVCGRRPGAIFDLEKWERIFATKPLVAETSIGGGGVVRAYVDSVTLPNSEISKRGMVGIKLPF